MLTAGTSFDQEKAREEGKPMRATVVTLLVTPEDAERISLAASEGQIMLTLRNPLDVAPTTTTGVRMANLLAAPAAPVVVKRVEGRRVREGASRRRRAAAPRRRSTRRGHSCAPNGLRSQSNECSYRFVSDSAPGSPASLLVCSWRRRRGAGRRRAGAPAPAAQATDASGFERVVLTAGRSTVLTTPFDVTRIAVTNPAVADAVVVQPREMLIDGKSAGTVSLIVWGANERRQYDSSSSPA